MGDTKGIPQGSYGATMGHNGDHRDAMGTLLGFNGTQRGPHRAAIGLQWGPYRAAMGALWGCYGDAKGTPQGHYGATMGHNGDHRDAMGTL